MDILDYMLPDQVRALSMHLEAQGEGGHPIYTVVSGNRIWYMKNAKGYPWDMNTFDNDFVYQSITEVDWNDARKFKMFASKSWAGWGGRANSNGGIVWAPRWIEPGATHNGIVTLDSSYRNYSDCSHYSVHNLGGPILAELIGPHDEDLGGDLGAKEVIKQLYRWGGNLENLEINTYALGFGWVQWELWTLQSGVYVTQKRTAFNHLAEGGSPEPVFPCGVPKIP